MSVSHFLPLGHPTDRSYEPRRQKQIVSLSSVRQSLGHEVERTGRAGDVGQMESELKAHLNGDAEGDKIVTSCMQVSGISIQLKN